MRPLALSAVLALAAVAGFSSLVGCSSAATSDEEVAANDSSTSDANALSVRSMKIGASLLTTASLNLRSGPSTGHSVLTVIPRGAAVTLKSTTSSNGWLAISYGSRSGYSSGQYLKVAPAGDKTSDETSDPGTSSGGGASDAVSRAKEWVAAEVPYCGGVEGGHDSICGGTCDRSGDANNSDWNSYRSDCSGLVSWAWGLAAPGLTTAGFAPYDTSESYEIDATTLQPGDAINSVPEQHIILFESWVDQASGQAQVIEEYNCGHVATEHVLTLEVSSGSSHVDVTDWSPHYFRAIRHR